jgi:hypothetical protein
MMSNKKERKERIKLIDDYGHLKLIHKMISEQLTIKKKQINLFVKGRDKLLGNDFEIMVINRESRLLDTKALEDKFGASVINGFRNKIRKSVEYQAQPIDEKNRNRLVRNSVKSVGELIKKVG